MDAETVVDRAEKAEARVAQVEASLASGQALVADLQTQLATATGERDAAKSLHAAVAADLLAKTKALDEEKAAHAVTAGRLDKALHALTNPAFADASARGERGAVPEGAPAGAEEPMTTAEAHSAYRKLTNPKKRDEFRAKYASILGC